MLLYSRPNASVKVVRKARRRDEDIDADAEAEQAQNDTLDHYENELAIAFLVYIGSLQAVLENFIGVPAEGFLATNGVVDQVMEQASQATLRAVIGDISQAGVAAAVQHVPADLAAAMTLSADNPFLQKYIQEETGRMIVAVSDGVRQQVKDVIADAARAGTSPADIALKIRDTIGLNPQQALQYKKFTGSEAVRQAFLQRLQHQRAMTVARSETALAFQHAQLASWQYAADQGVLEGFVEKEWRTDSNPCKERCEPMNGQRRGLDQPFLTGMGEEVMAPGCHPNCRCVLLLHTGVQ